MPDDAPGHDPGPPSPIDRAAEAASIASDFGAIWVVATVAQVLAGRGSAGDAWRRLAAAGCTSLVLTRVLKHHFAVPRAAETGGPTLARTPSSTSFPSGHTLAAFTSAFVIPRTPRWRVIALCFAAVVAWARVRVGHHRLADVAAGAAVGTLAGLAIAGALGRPGAAAR